MKDTRSINSVFDSLSISRGTDAAELRGDLVDSVHSAKKTDKWPIYAVYKCPDGSRRTWKRKVKVITKMGDKLLIE